MHAPGPAAAEPRRGRPLPVPPGGVLGAQQQRLPRQRRPAVPRRRLPPRVRHPGVRLDPRPRHPRQGGRADPRAAPRVRRAAPPRGGHPRRHLPLQEQHRLRRQQLRLPRELPHVAARRLRPLRRGAHPVLRVAADLRRRRQGAADGPRRDVLHRPAGRAHLGGRVVRHHPQPPDHQHPRRAARRRRALPPPARHRRRLEHERVRHLPQGRGHVDPAAHARGPEPGAARPHAREPDPGDPRDQPRHHLPPQGPPRQRAGAVGPRHPERVPRQGAEVRRDQGPLAAGEAGAADVGALRHHHRATTRWTSTASATG